jgi:cytochrome c556
MVEAKQQQSIVTIIQNMLASGETADKILLTLKDMNVPEEQAKTLLMIAQTNTLSVLKGDIALMINEYLSQKYPDLEKQLTEMVNVKMQASQNQITDNVLNNVKAEQNDYQAKQQKLVDKVVNVSVEQDTKIEIVKNKLNELGATFDKVALGSTKSMIAMRISSFVVGLALTIVLIVKFLNITPGYSIDYLIFYAIIGLLAGILFVLSLI